MTTQIISPMFQFQMPPVPVKEKQIDIYSPIDERLNIVIVCNDFYFKILLDKKIILPKDTQLFNQLMSEKLQVQRMLKLEYIFMEKFRCNVILTKMITISPDVKLIYKSMIETQPNEIYKIYKYIYIIGDEELGYQELIQSCFYLGLGHQVILIIDKLHQSKLFFAIDELKEIRKYPKEHLRSKRDYYGSLDNFLHNIEKNGFESVFRLRPTYEKQLENIDNHQKVLEILDSYISQLSYQFSSFPTFNQKRIDFDAPYCSISNLENSFLPISSVCRFTMKPLLKFAFYFGYLLRFSIILYNRERTYVLQRDIDTPSKYVEYQQYNKNFTESSELNTLEIEPENINLNRFKQNLDISKININETITSEQVDTIRLKFQDVLHKLNKYFDYLKKIEYLEVYDQIDEDEQDKIFGIKVFCKLDFNFDTLEDYDITKFNFLHYFITRKFTNPIWTKEELQYVRTERNSDNVDYEFDISRNISKYVKTLFEENNEMKDRLLELYKQIEEDKIYNQFLYEKYAINVRLQNLYKFILGDNVVNETKITSEIREVNEEAKTEKKLDYVVYKDFDKDKDILKIFKIYDLNLSPEDLVKKFLENRKRKNDELKEKIATDSVYRKIFLRENRINQLRSNFPQLKEEQLIKMYEEEREEKKLYNQEQELEKKKNKKNRKTKSKKVYLNKINKIILKEQIPYIRLTNYFILNINNNRYQIYVSSVPDNTEIQLFLNLFSTIVPIDCFTDRLPPSEERLGTQLLKDEKGYYYKKKIYFVKELPLAQDIVEIPFDIKNYVVDENEKIFKHIPREQKNIEINKFRKILYKKIKREYYQINMPITVQFSEKTEQFYFSTQRMTRKKQSDIEFEVSNRFINDYIRPKGLQLLFKPENVFLINRPSASDAVLYIQREDHPKDILETVLIKTVKNTLISNMKISEEDILNISLDIDVVNEKNKLNEEGIINLNEFKTEKQEMTMQTVKKSYEEFDTKIERPLTICQGFYQFISLTYLMDLFENLNTGRRFLKNMGDINNIGLSDIQIDRKNWRNIVLPELITE